MKPPFLLAVVFLLTGVASAWAQVSTDDRALDQLAPSAPIAHSAPATVAPRLRKPAVVRSSRAPTVRRPVAKPVALPAVPPLPPPNAVIRPPEFVMPPHPPPLPPPVPVSADAKGIAAPIPSGTRITFGPGSSVLNPATLAALRQIAQAARAQPAMTVSVTAYAPGNANDPSTPRRLSLDRALAARGVLIQEGVASNRILALAHGPPASGDDPLDRVDVLQILPPAPVAQAKP